EVTFAPAYPAPGARYAGDSARRPTDDDASGASDGAGKLTGRSARPLEAVALVRSLRGPARARLARWTGELARGRSREAVPRRRIRCGGDHPRNARLRMAEPPA